MIQLSKEQEKLVNLLAGAHQWKKITEDTPLDAYNRNKIIEELFELGEAITKFQTKSLDNPSRPTMTDITGEFADVVVRGIVYLVSQRHHYGFTLEEILADVNKAIEAKIVKLNGYVEEGTYKHI